MAADEGVRGRPNAPSRLVVAVALTVLVIVAVVVALVASSIDSGAAPADATTTTTWSEATTYCADGLEHRIFVGPTNGDVAPNIDVVPWDPSCRP